MRFAKFILIVLFCLGIKQIGSAQYYLKTKSDSIVLESDSVLLSVDDYRGALAWQTSTDLINWMTLNEVTDTLGVRIDGSSYYRATVADGTCNLVMSDTIKVIENITEVEGNQFTVNSIGGVYLLPTGIKIKIPPGAVSESVSIEMNMLDSVSASSEMQFVSDSGKLFINALQFKPEGLRFQKPIKIRVPGKGYKSSNLPMVHSLNSSNDEWKEYDGYLLCSQKEDFVEFITDSLCHIRIDAIPNVFNSSDNLKSTQDCREGLIKINSSAHDLSLIHKSNECFVYQNEGSVEFLECEIPKEFWKIREISPHCIPEVEIYINGDENKSMMKIGEQIELTFKTHVRGIPLENQFVNVALPSGIQEGFLMGYTDENGQITFPITQVIEDLNGEIDFVGDFEYCLQLIEVTANGVNESVCQISPLHKTLIINHKQIAIYDDCSDPNKINCSQMSDPNCESIKNSLVERIEIDPEYPLIDIGETIEIEVTGFNFINEEIQVLPEINWTSNNLSVATVANGIIQGEDDGLATVTASICKLKEDCHVTVGDEICDSTIVIIDNNQIELALGETYEMLVEYGESPGGNIYIPFVHIESLNENIVTVEDLTIKGEDVGTTTITVNWCDTIMEISVTVSKSFMDGRDGQVYELVTIGGQTWMAENLNYSGVESMCYDDNSAYCGIYGRLYRWPVAQNVCPSGWHLPSREEHLTLRDGLGGYKVAACKLKATDYWIVPYDCVTNESGFTGLPAGYAVPDENGIVHFKSLGWYSWMWNSSTRRDPANEESIQEGLLYLSTENNWAGVAYSGWSGMWGSVRCIKD